MKNIKVIVNLGNCYLTVQVVFEILVNVPLDSNFFELKIFFEDRTLTWGTVIVPSPAFSWDSVLYHKVCIVCLPFDPSVVLVKTWMIKFKSSV